MAPMGIRLSPLGVAVFCLLGVGVIYHLYAGVISNRLAAFRWDCRHFTSYMKRHRGITSVGRRYDLSFPCIRCFLGLKLIDSVIRGRWFYLHFAQFSRSMWEGRTIVWNKGPCFWKMVPKPQKAWSLPDFQSRTGRPCISVWNGTNLILKWYIYLST